MWCSPTPRLTIRQLGSVDQVRDIVSARVAAWGRKPGALDHQIYFAMDKKGFFVGELDGKVIGCISAIKFSDRHGVLANFVVDRPYRGKGYGQALLRAAVGTLPQKCNFTFDIHAKKSQLIQNTQGFKIAWKYRRVIVEASKAVKALSASYASFPVNVWNVREVPFTQLVAYDAHFHSYDTRPFFLKMWTTAPNYHSFVATSKSGSVVGYSVVRKALRPEDGWRINPLYADSIEIAVRLYQAVFKKVMSEDYSASVTMDVPNLSKKESETFKIMKLISAKTDELIARGYRYQVPSNFPLKFVYVM